jgi:hypothetical protein
MSAEENLAGVVNGQDSFTFRTTETARFQRFKLFGADGAGKHLGEKGHGLCGGALSEKINGIVEIVFDVKKLRESKQLENLVNLWLNFQKYQIPAPGFYRF